MPRAGGLLRLPGGRNRCAGRADYTPIACTEDALRALGDKALGCVLNDVRKVKYEEYYRAYYR